MSVETIIPIMNRYAEARVFGYGIDSLKISFMGLLRSVYTGGETIIHTHRNNEILFALLLRSWSEIQAYLYKAFRQYLQVLPFVS